MKRQNPISDSKTAPINHGIFALTETKPASLPLKNGWLEDDPFLLGIPYFQGQKVSFWECNSLDSNSFRIPFVEEKRGGNTSAISDEGCLNLRRFPPTLLKTMQLQQTTCEQ